MNRSQPRFSIAVILMLSVWAGNSCKQQVASTEELSVEATTQSNTAPRADESIAARAPQAYPLGRWRLAPPQALTNVFIGTSHILIRHEASDLQVPGSVAPWRLAPPPNRSREDALALAEDLVAKLSAEPSRFAQLAHEHTEDRTTQLEGGSQGAGRATDFLHEPSILDALSALRPGEISRVVETSHGFQIIQRHPLPPPASVTGRHIVIGHDDTRWLALVGATAPSRSHGDALALARAIWQQAVASPDRFQELVERHSEHPDKANGGDMGTWSVREPTHYPRGIQALRALPIGGVHRPIESHLGFEIVQRTEAPPRGTYAIEAIKLAFQPGDQASRQAALQRAEELVSMLALEPSRFDELRRQYCCEGAERWVEGREEPGLTPVVRNLAFGNVSAEPAPQFLNIVIPRRVDPSKLPPEPEPQYEIPAPEQPPILWGMAQLPGAIVARELEALSKEPQPILALNPQEIESLRQAATELLSNEARDDATLLRRFNSLLGEARAKHYIDLIAQRLASVILKTTSTL